jgi:hypothetical protein
MDAEAGERRWTSFKGPGQSGALLFPLREECVTMRKPEAAAAAKSPLATGHREGTPTELVCLALALAVVVLVIRIASIW